MTTFEISGSTYHNVYDPSTNTYKLVKLAGSGPAEIGSSGSGTYTSQSGQQMTSQQAIQSGQIDNPKEDIKFHETAQAARQRETEAYQGKTQTEPIKSQFESEAQAARQRESQYYANRSTGQLSQDQLSSPKGSYEFEQSAKAERQREAEHYATTPQEAKQIESLLRSPTAEFSSHETAQKAYDIVGKFNPEFKSEDVKAHLKASEKPPTKEEFDFTGRTTYEGGKVSMTPEEIHAREQYPGQYNVRTPYFSPAPADQQQRTEEIIREARIDNWWKSLTPSQKIAAGFVAIEQNTISGVVDLLGIRDTGKSYSEKAKNLEFYVNPFSFDPMKDNFRLESVSSDKGTTTYQYKDPMKEVNKGFADIPSLAYKSMNIEERQVALRLSGRTQETGYESAIEGLKASIPFFGRSESTTLAATILSFGAAGSVAPTATKIIGTGLIAQQVAQSGIYAATGREREAAITAAPLLLMTPYLAREVSGRIQNIPYPEIRTGIEFDVAGTKAFISESGQILSKTSIDTAKYVGDVTKATEISQVLGKTGIQTGQYFQEVGGASLLKISTELGKPIGTIVEIGGIAKEGSVGAAVYFKDLGIQTSGRINLELMKSVDFSKEVSGIISEGSIGAGQYFKGVSGYVATEISRPILFTSDVIGTSSKQSGEFFISEGLKLSSYVGNQIGRPISTAKEFVDIYGRTTEDTTRYFKEVGGESIIKIKSTVEKPIVYFADMGSVTKEVISKSTGETVNFFKETGIELTKPVFVASKEFSSIIKESSSGSKDFFKETGIDISKFVIIQAERPVIFAKDVSGIIRKSGVQTSEFLTEEIGAVNQKYIVNPAKFTSGIIDKSFKETGLFWKETGLETGRYVVSKAERPIKASKEMSEILRKSSMQTYTYFEDISQPIRDPFIATGKSFKQTGQFFGEVSPIKVVGKPSKIINVRNLIPTPESIKYQFDLMNPLETGRVLEPSAKPPIITRLGRTPYPVEKSKLSKEEFEYMFPTGYKPPIIKSIERTPFPQEPTPISIKHQYNIYDPFQTGREFKLIPKTPKIETQKGYVTPFDKVNPQSIKHQFNIYDPFQTGRSLEKSPRPPTITLGKNYRSLSFVEHKPHTKEEFEYLFPTGYKPPKITRTERTPLVFPKVESKSKELRDVFRDIAGNTIKQEKAIGSKYSVLEGGFVPKIDIFQKPNVRVIDLSKQSKSFESRDLTPALKRSWESREKPEGKEVKSDKSKLIQIQKQKTEQKLETIDLSKMESLKSPIYKEVQKEIQKSKSESKEKSSALFPVMTRMFSKEQLEAQQKSSNYFGSTTNEKSIGRSMEKTMDKQMSRERVDSKQRLKLDVVPKQDSLSKSFASIFSIQTEKPLEKSLEKVTTETKTRQRERQITERLGIPTLPVISGFDLPSYVERRKKKKTSRKISSYVVRNPFPTLEDVIGTSTKTKSKKNKRNSLLMPKFDIPNFNFNSNKQKSKRRR